MSAAIGQVRWVSATYTFPHVAIDIIDARKPVQRVVHDSGINEEHTIGAEMSNMGSLQSSWRFVGSAGPAHAPCDALSYVPAHIPWGTSIAGRGIASGIACRFSPAYFDNVTRIGGDWSKRHLQACRDLSSRKIREMLRQIYSEVHNPSFASDIAISSLSQLILVELSRYFHGIPKVEDARHGGVLSRSELIRIRNLVDNALDQRLSIKRLADALGYSEGHFHAIFKQTTGHTPHKYIESARMRRAMELITQDALSIKQIAYAVGFSSPSSFSAAFRRVAGFSPSQSSRVNVDHFIAKLDVFKNFDKRI